MRFSDMDWYLVFRDFDLIDKYRLREIINNLIAEEEQKLYIKKNKKR